MNCNFCLVAKLFKTSLWHWNLGFLFSYLILMNLIWNFCLCLFPKSGLHATQLEKSFKPVQNMGKKTQHAIIFKSCLTCAQWNTVQGHLIFKLRIFFCKYTLISNLMPATCFKTVATGSSYYYVTSHFFSETRAIIIKVLKMMFRWFNIRFSFFFFFYLGQKSAYPKSIFFLAPIQIVLLLVIK